MHSRRRSLSLSCYPPKRRASLEGLEALEDRCVPTVTFSEYALPTGNSQPAGIVTGPDGALWFTEANANKVGRITTAGAIIEYALPNGTKPAAITVGADGALWITEAGLPDLGRLTTTGQFTQYAIPANTKAVDITSGPDGALWFTTASNNEIGRMTTSGAVTLYTIPTSNAKPEGITTGPDGALWFTENGSNKIGRITTSGVFSEWTIPTTSCQPTHIVAGPDGALWFTEWANGADKIGRITTAGSITEYALPTTGSNPDDITVGADGNLWFTLNDNNTNAIGQITTAGVITEYTVPTAKSLPDGITAGPDGAIWFTENGVSQIGQLVFDPPLTATGTTIQSTEQASFSGTVATFTDADPNAPPTSYSVTIAWGDGSTSSGTVSGANGQFQVTGTHLYTEEGSYTVTVTITDDGYGTQGGGASATATSTANVTDAALASSSLSQTLSAVEGATTGSVMVATFTDPGTDGTAGDYTATIQWGDGQTSVGTVSPGTNGTFQVNGSHVYAEEGTYTVLVTIQDVGGSSVTLSETTFDISDAPLTATRRNVSAVEGATFSGIVADFSDANPASNLSDFSATVNWGDGSTSTANVSANGQGGFAVHGSHTYTQAGNYTVTVTITDVGGSTAQVSDTASIGDAPLSGTGITANTGTLSPFSGTIASFTDANPNGQAGQFTAQINWGDGFSSTGSIAANGQGGFDVTGTHLYLLPGVYTVSITVHDVGGASVVIQSAINVGQLNGTGATFTTVEDNAWSGQVADFTNPYDPGLPPSDYTATITWGDGTTSTGTVVLDQNGGMAVLGSHTYAEAGRYQPTISIRCTDGFQGTAVDNAQVNDAALQASGANINATLGSALTAVVATFSDGNTAATTSDFTVNIDWGDGRSSAGVVQSLGGGRFDVKGTHAYTAMGTYTVSIQITDRDGSSATASDTVTVADAPLTASGTQINATKGHPYTGPVASFTDGDAAATAGSYSVIVTWGDGTSSVGTVIANGSGSFTVSGSKVYTLASNYTIHVQIRDAEGTTATATTTANVTAGSASNPGSSSPPLSQPTPSTPTSSPPTPAPEPPSGPATPILTLAVEILTGPVGSFSPSSNAPFAGPAHGTDRPPELTPLASSASESTADGSSDKGGDTAGTARSSRPRSALAAAPAVTSVAGSTIQVVTPVSPNSPSSVGRITAAPVHTSAPLATASLNRALDQFQRDVEQNRHRPTWAVDAVFASGVAMAGYVALTSRVASWLMTALLSRPLWREFDPIEILFAWEAAKRDGSPAPEDDESLQSLVTAPH